MTGPSLHVTKIDSSRRQLESAIRLFFVNGDVVSIHTLMAAARAVLRDLVREAGLPLGMDPAIRPEKVAEFNAIINGPQNFFKHADRDPEGTIEFNPRTTEALMFDACEMYIGLTSETTALMATYRVWFAHGHPDLLTEEIRQKTGVGQGQVDVTNRAAFLAEFLPLAEELLSGASGTVRP